MTPLQSVHAFGIGISVLFQEMARYGFYKLIARAEPNLKLTSELKLNDRLSRLSYAMSGGLGFGLIR